MKVIYTDSNTTSNSIMTSSFSSYRRNSSINSGGPEIIATTNNVTSSSRSNNCCGTTTSARGGGGGSSELKLYQAFIFSVPIFFTFILLFLFYIFYLRRRRVDWSSLRMRTPTATNSDLPTITSTSNRNNIHDDDLSRCELGGLKKELREMLPIIVFNASFSVNDTQCSVCLGDYQGEDRLQQIPACGHTFHMDCIDLWLATHTTCPLCRQSLLEVTKSHQGGGGEEEEEEDDSNNVETNNNSSTCNDRDGDGDETSHQNGMLSNEDPQGSQPPPLESEDTEEEELERVIPTVGEGNNKLQNDDVERQMENAK